MGQAQINVRIRACSRTSIARTKQAALTHNVRGKELIYYSACDAQGVANSATSSSLGLCIMLFSAINDSIFISIAIISCRRVTVHCIIVTYRIIQTMR